MNNIQYLVKLANKYYDMCCNFTKIATIKQLSNGKYRVMSMKGKNLGTYDSRKEAEKRLKQIEAFKHMDESDVEDQESDVIDLTNAIELSYSAIMREMRQHASKEQVREFLILFKKEFDNSVKNGLEYPEKIALKKSLIKFNKMYKIKLKLN